MSLCIINVGRPRTGKTTKAKQILNLFIENGKKSDIIIYDVNNEYHDFFNESFLSYDKFLTKHKNSTDKFFLFEEATIYFSNKSTDKILTDFLVRRRHTHNNIILNFHSIRSIPRYIFELSNYVILFKTNDTEDVVKSKCDNPKFLKAFKSVNENSNEHYNLTFDLYS